MDLAQPRLMQQIVDVGMPQHDLSLIGRVGAFMLVAAVLGWFFGSGCTVYSTLAGLNFGADIRAELMTKVQAMACADLDRMPTGRLITRLTNDVDQVQRSEEHTSE